MVTVMVQESHEPVQDASDISDRWSATAAAVKASVTVQDAMVKAKSRMPHVMYVVAAGRWKSSIKTHFAVNPGNSLYIKLCP